MPDGQLKLSVVDVYGDAVQEPVHILLTNQTLASAKSAIHSTAAKPLLIKNLEATPNGRYQIEVDALSYLPVSQFINIPGDKPASLVITLPVNAKRVTDVIFPEFALVQNEAKRLLTESTIANRSGEVLYNGLDEIRKAGFLNLTVKAQQTKLLNGETVLQNLERITEQRGDRLFAFASASLHSEVVASVAAGVFSPASSLLHTPPDGYVLADSFKTPERYGNLQLTFSRRQADWAVDMDIDDAQGFEHFFQVVGNALTSQPTHPYNIHEILVRYQELDPEYRFQLASQKKPRTAAGTA